MLTWKEVIGFSVNGNSEPDRRVEKQRTNGENF